MSAVEATVVTHMGTTVRFVPVLLMLLGQTGEWVELEVCAVSVECMWWLEAENWNKEALGYRGGANFCSCPHRPS